MALAIALLVLIQSCGGFSSKERPARGTYSEAQRWEELANTSTGQQRAVYQLSAAEAWYGGLEIERALFTLLNIDTVFLPDNELVDHSLLLAEVLQLQGRHQDALIALREPVLQKRIGNATIKRQTLWAERLGNLHLTLEEYELAARHFDYGLSIARDRTNLRQMREGLWTSLIRVKELPQAPYQSSEMAGWIALAEINNESAGTLDDQLKSFQNWRRIYINHPAATSPPESIAVLTSLATETPPKVALLLPLSGNLASAGNAVLEGYLATVVANKSKDPLSPAEVMVFDTNAQSMSGILRELRAAQVDLVVGPLQKEKVSAFTLLADPEMRALTLNSIEEDTLGNKKLILGLALDIENEARQAATAALRDGHVKALALVPDNNSGDRASSAFANSWAEQNGVLAGIDRFQSEDTYADILESRLHIKQSVSRMSELRRLLAVNLEFNPRRREDIDALFLTASTEQARQIKPMLAFFFADDIPVYSTSSVFDGQQNNKANQDLDGIKFSTIPWLVRESEIHNMLNKGSNNSGALKKLQAMGVDAYYLSQRIPQFIVAGNAVYHGVLGNLSLNVGERNLDRQQVWAEFDQGSVRVTE